jgi:hypothetical protein
MTINPKEDYFIELLKFGKDIGIKGITLSQALDWAGEKGYIDRNNTDDNELFAEVVDECFNKTPRTNASAANLYILKTESYFYLIDYQELQEARQASLDANRNAKDAHDTAKIAIYISIAALILSAAISIWQICSPVKINQDQIDKLTHPNATINQRHIEELTNRKYKLDEEQLKTLTTKPIKFDPEQLEIIKGWMEARKPQPTKKANK